VLLSALILTALALTTVLSAAGAGLSTFYLNASKETLTFWRQKAEQLFVETEMLERVLSNYFEHSYSLMESQVAPSDESALEKAGDHLAVMKMLIGLYLPSLSAMLTRIIAATATAHRGLRAVQKAKPADREALIESVDAAVCELKEALDSLKDGLAREAGRLNQGGMAGLLWRPSRAAPVGRLSNVPA
jgi:hypothetical protein